MSSAKVEIKGMKEFVKQLRGLGAKAEKEIKQALARGGVAIHREAVTSIQKGPKTGEKYGNHQASAPGEAPATDTGQLVSGIMITKEDNGFTVKVASRAPYTFYLEFGTKNESGGWAIKPRPFMGPAWKHNLPTIKRELMAAMKVKP
jgi:HK97 gp10 family phage protein